MIQKKTKNKKQKMKKEISRQIFQRHKGRISEEIKEQINKLAESKWGSKQIADRFGFSQMTVN